VLSHCFCEAFGVMRLGSEEPHLDVDEGRRGGKEEEAEVAGAASHRRRARTRR
jgi:hypothetical protein